MGMVYQWKSGASVKIDAQVAGAELDRLRVFNNNRLTPQIVVEASRPEDAPLHDHFEWNDAMAAEAYRLSQGSYLIRSIEVVADENAAERPPIRAFVNVQRDEDRSYTSTFHALSDDDLRAQILAQAWRELEAWHRRYAELAELAKIFSAISEARPAI